MDNRGMKRIHSGYLPGSVREQQPFSIAGILMGGMGSNSLLAERDSGFYYRSGDNHGPQGAS
jgi:hypothetical protein